MRNRWIFVLLAFVIPMHVLAQPPLSKKLQKEKEEFEALIAAEKKYDSLVVAADEAFQNKDYLLARMTYEDAIPYSAEKEQWLISKVNDLDILMAKNAARQVDSILVSLPTKQARKLKENEGDSPSIAARPAPDKPAPQPKKEEPLVEEIAEVEEEVIQEKKEEEAPISQPETKKVAVEEKVEKPKAPPTPTEKPQPKPEEKVKVKEDFTAYDDGITEETFDLPNHTVLRIVVKEGIDVMVFKRVKHNWGGEFYFLDDVGTTQRYWTEQVEKYRKKYPSNDQ